MNSIRLAIAAAILMGVGSAWAGSFTEGYCTYGVDRLKSGNIDWSGDAKNWYANAKAAGYQVGSTPKVGAIVVWPGVSANGGSGHVGVITSTSPLTYKAMNDYNPATKKVERGVYVERPVAQYPSISNPVSPIGYIYFDQGKPGAQQPGKSASAAVPVYNSRFLRDVNYPDGAMLRRGERFTKKWEVVNTGNVPWPAGTIRVVAVDKPGQQIAQALPSLPSQVAPNATALISIPMAAPGQGGRYRGYYQLQGPNGPFGTKFYVDFIAQ